MTEFELGVKAYIEKNYSDAKKYFEIVIQHEPDNIVAYHNCGIASVQLNLNEEALEYLKVSSSRGYVDSYISLGAALRNLGRYKESLEAFSACFNLDPNNATAYSNYSNTLREFGHTERALDFIKIANKLKPDNTSLLNESITYLTLGDLTEGWKKYDYRWYHETGENIKPKLPGPEYDGSQNINGCVVLVYHEQGFGDCIQFARYITMLEQRNARVILVSKPPLVNLFKYNYPNCLVVSWTDTVPNYHYHVALLDLPKCFDTTINNIPSPTPYLTVDDNVKSKWQNILGVKTKPRIGINWTSNGIAYNTKFRKMEVSEILELVSDEYQFINLHHGTTDVEKNLLDKFNVLCYDHGDFYDTAGLISNLDCVITVDTVTAHLSGALGVPTFVMLPNYGCDWRWFMNRDDSPFYNSVKLFRKTNDNWNSIFDTLKIELKKLTQ